jgi:hypothetical protein
MFGRKGLHPSQLIAIAFTAIILSGTLLLSLPVATQSGEIDSISLMHYSLPPQQQP